MTRARLAEPTLTCGLQNDPNAKLIPEVHDLSTLAVDTGSTTAAGSEFATGGMVTKLVAARIATCSGCRCVVLNL